MVDLDLFYGNVSLIPNIFILEKSLNVNVSITVSVEIIILARNVKPNLTAPKVKLTFHPRPLILDCHIRFSEITGLFELKFHMENNTSLFSRKKQYKYYIYFRSLDENGHHPHLWQNKMCLNNKPNLTLTYFNIIKEIR